MTTMEGVLVGATLGVYMEPDELFTMGSIVTDIWGGLETVEEYEGASEGW